MNKWKFLAGGAVIFLLYWFASPFITLYHMQQAVKAHDADKLSSYIDFPKVRQSVKDQMNVVLLQETQKLQQQQNPFAGLGAMFAATMVDKLIDAAITPDAIGLLMQGKTLKASMTASVPSTETSSTGERSQQQPVDYSFEYQSLNKFAVLLPSKKGETVQFVLSRDGLGWKLTEIKLPLTEKS